MTGRRVLGWTAACWLVAGVASADLRSAVLPANDILYDPLRDVLYASLAARAGSRGNTVAIVDPETGEIVDTLFVGSEPGPMALADDASVLYVGLGGAPQVVRVDLAAWQVDLTFPVGEDPFFGPLYAEDLEVQPGDPDVVAVSLERRHVSPRHGGVAVYDDGVRRPSTTPDHTGSNRIEFSDDPSLLYGYNNETTEFGFRTLRVDETGVTELHVERGLFDGFGIDIEFAGGLVFSSGGQVVDPFGPALLGGFTSTEGFLVAVAPAPEIDRVYFLADQTFGGGGSAFIETFELSTFRSLSRVALGLLPSEEPRGRLVRWGDESFAFMSTQSRLYLLTPGGSTGACLPDETTLCLPDPGDRRFQVRVQFETQQGGGAAGAAKAQPLALLGIGRGGLFTFFNPANPEMLLKILDGCPVSGTYWVFYSATTNVGFEVEVIDTATGAAWRRANPDRHPAAPVQHTAAFPCP